jgi:mannose-6-phosphate isomerase
MTGESEKLHLRPEEFEHRPEGYEKRAFPFTVEKPWGKEFWLDLIKLPDGRGYCTKHIHINAGVKTSYQYHDKKFETNYIVSGTAEVWLEDHFGKVQKYSMGPGDSFTVMAPKKHRVIALTDLVMHETSSPEVDDVIRINDDSGRGDGKIKSEHGN